MQRTLLGSALVLLLGIDGAVPHGTPGNSLSPAAVCPPPAGPGEPLRSIVVRPGVRLETVARGLEIPWALAFPPDGRILVTERPGRVRVIDKAGLHSEAWADWSTLSVPDSLRVGAEFLGLALSPDFSTTRQAYLFVSLARRGRIAWSRVYRLTEHEGRAARAEIVVDSLPANDSHAGGALVFGGDGSLYASVGEAGMGRAPHDRELLAGKILRIDPGNPSRDRGARVYAAGLRNVQGMTWHSTHRALLAVEHGPTNGPGEGGRRDQDELNHIRPGEDYGWPTVSGMSADPRFTPPMIEWTPAIAPAGIAEYTGSVWSWRGDLFVTGLRGQQLRRIRIAPDPNRPARLRVLEQEILIEGGLGRLRAVGMGVDGCLYFATSNRDRRGMGDAADDRLFRLHASRVQP
ncbi:MAG TPA: PQQ-dependent sugar dehydrogenase [Longimicrobiaceae bacterium]|nr:PQQ-dependent sugar dehydrogenase [Longimicrobiaceae bacterium]